MTTQTMQRAAGRNRRRFVWILGGVAALSGVSVLILAERNWSQAKLSRSEVPAERAKPAQQKLDPGEVLLTSKQQARIGLKVEPVSQAVLPIVLRAPGRVMPDEAHYAHITPRAAGIVRSVNARIGQRVKKGDVLATIDSEEVGQARLALVTSQQELEVASTQAQWQQTIHHNTLDLLALLEQKASPDEIHERFRGRPVGEQREQLITSYAKYRKAQFSLDRIRSLQERDAVSLASLQEVRAEQEAAQATYQSLMDEMRFTSQLALTRALQAQRQADTAVRIAWERMRILGADSPELARLVEQNDEAVAASEAKADTAADTEPPPVKPEGLQPRAIVSKVIPDAGKLASTYDLVAPFDGVVLDREPMVPGLAVEKTSRLFTLADLSTVWIDVNVYESSLAELLGSADAEVRIVTPAYPDRVFLGSVLYTGDMVDEKTSSVQLLAKAANPEHSLKPGMFVQVELVRTPRTASLCVPDSALLTEGKKTYVYVRLDAERFARREVFTRPSANGRSAVLSGLQAGEEVVTQQAFKLKAEALRVAASES